jgi:carbon monoxide dehydrogenase subunit G
MAYEVEVPVRHHTLWLAFTDPEKMARAVPGLTVDAVQPVDVSAAPEGVSGDVVAGRLKLKVGAGTITYRGTARIADAAAQDGTLDIAIDVAQARGNGALAGYLRLRLTPSGEQGGQTTVSVVTELELSGRALEVGSAELAEAAGALAGQWLTALAEEWVTAGPATVVADELPSASDSVADSAAVLDSAASVASDSSAVSAPSTAKPAKLSQEPAGTAVLVPVASQAPETLLADSLSADPLAPLWRGEVEKSPWPRVAAALWIMLLIRRRQRRRRRSSD